MLAIHPLSSPISSRQCNVEDAAWYLHNIDAVLGDELQVAWRQFVVVLIHNDKVLPVLETCIEYAPPLVHASLDIIILAYHTSLFLPVWPAYSKDMVLSALA